MQLLQRIQEIITPLQLEMKTQRIFFQQYLLNAHNIQVKDMIAPVQKNEK